MIKNLITALGMTLIYTGQPLNATETITQTIEATTKASTKSNTFTKYSYDENENLLEANEIATIEYKPIIINNVGNVIQRARISTSRDIENDDYSIRITLLTRIDKQEITINNQWTYYTVNLPEPTKVDYTSEETYIAWSYKGAFSTTDTEFIEGQNYNSYEELINIPLNNNRYAIGDEMITANNTTYGYDIDAYTYLVTNVYIYYNGTQLTDSGTNLLNNKDILSTIKYEIEYSVNIDPSQYEVIDIPGFMFQILGMPFAWLSMAFDFTLFPGTPYAIRISAILLGLLFSLIAIVIFRLVMKGK